METVDTLLLIRGMLFFILLFISAIFSGAEIALFSLTPVQVDMLADDHGSRGKLVKLLLSEKRRLLVTIYIGNELANVSIAAVTAMLAHHIFGQSSIAIASFVGTFTLLVFGDITPKTFALRHAEKYSLSVAGPLYLFFKMVHPLQRLITWMTNMLVRATGTHTGDQRMTITEDEIKTMLTHGETKGEIQSDEKEMIFNVFELGDTVVTEIMTPRTEIFSLPLEEGKDGIVRRAVLSNYSRIPVYGKSPDYIVGVLYTKDLLDRERVDSLERVEELLHEPYFVPETKKIDELLREFQTKHIHMAMVLDEYGGVSGLVSMDDILEEVVGEPPDSKTLTEIEKVSDGNYLVPARLELEDFNEYFGTSLEEEEIETVGGLVFHHFGRVPRWGESVTVSGIRFTVRKLKGVTIWQVAVRLPRDGSLPMPQQEGIR